MHCSTRVRSRTWATYANPELDALLEKARVERGCAQRIGMYQQAQQTIVDDAAAIFLDHGLSFFAGQAGDQRLCAHADQHPDRALSVNRSALRNKIQIYHRPTGT